MRRRESLPPYSCVAKHIAGKEKKDMKWIIGAVCMVAAITVLGIFTVGMAVTIAAKYQTD